MKALRVSAYEERGGSLQTLTEENLTERCKNVHLQAIALLEQGTEQAAFFIAVRSKEKAALESPWAPSAPLGAPSFLKMATTTPTFATTTMALLDSSPWSAAYLLAYLAQPAQGMFHTE